jgi:hypothetical protein
MAYNPVSNPNPDLSPARLPSSVMSQGHDGNIVRSGSSVDMNRNLRSSSAPCYGEDCFGDDVDGSVDE